MRAGKIKGSQQLIGMAEFLWCAGAGAAISWYAIWRRTSAGRMLALVDAGSGAGAVAGPARFSLGERILCCSVWSLIGATIGAMFWLGLALLFWLFEFVEAL